MALFNHFNERPCVLPGDLINRENVEITINQKDNSLNVKFSEAISKEFAWWGRRKVDNLLYNIKTSLSYRLMNEHLNDASIEIAYDLVFKDMFQLY
jgi:hypothetical protein